MSADVEWGTYVVRVAMRMCDSLLECVFVCGEKQTDELYVIENHDHRIQAKSECEGHSCAIYVECGVLTCSILHCCLFIWLSGICSVCRQRIADAQGEEMVGNRKIYNIYVCVCMMSVCPAYPTTLRSCVYIHVWLVGVWWHLSVFSWGNASPQFSTTDNIVLHMNWWFST